MVAMNAIMLQQLRVTQSLRHALNSVARITTIVDLRDLEQQKTIAGCFLNT